MIPSTLMSVFRQLEQVGCRAFAPLPVQPVKDAPPPYADTLALGMDATLHDGSAGDVECLPVIHLDFTGFVNSRAKVNHVRIARIGRVAFQRVREEQ